MITSLYTVLMSEDVHQSAQFFIDFFQFQETFRSDWYISLKNVESGFELAFIDSKHGTVPQAYQSKASGLIINIEVDMWIVFMKNCVSKKKWSSFFPLRVKILVSAISL